MIDVVVDLNHHFEMKKLKVDSKAVLKRAKDRPIHRKVSFTFDKKLYDEFQEACLKEAVPASRVLEELIRTFLESDKKG